MQNLTSMYDSEGQIYDLPDDKVETFKQKRGGERAFDYRLPDGSEYSIPESKAARFAEVHPDAQPLRSISFADGTRRSFTGAELKDFLSPRGELANNPKYKVDFDEAVAADDARRAEAAKVERQELEESIGREGMEKWNAEAKAASDKKWLLAQGKGSPTAAGIKGAISAEGVDDMLWAARRGRDYVAGKFVGGLAHVFTGAMRLADSAARAFGAKPFFDNKEIADEVDRTLAPTEQEKEAVGAPTRVAGAVAGTAGSLLTWDKAFSSLGFWGGNALMTAEAGNDAYLGTYDAAIASGKSPEEANRIATKSGVAATATTALYGLAVKYLGQLFNGKTQVSADSFKGEGFPDFNSLVKAVQKGELAKYIKNTAAAATGAGVSGGAGDYFQTVYSKEATGDEANWADPEAWWNAAEGFATNFGLMGALSAMNYREYRRNVSDAVDAQARAAATMPETRAAWREMFPEGSRNVIEKRMRGEDISRADIAKAGFPEMSKAERNQVADWMLMDLQSFAEGHMEEIKAAKAAKTAAAETQRANQEAFDKAKSPLDETTKEGPKPDEARANETPAEPAEAEGREPAAKPEAPRQLEAEPPRAEATGEGVVKPTETAQVPPGPKLKRPRPAEAAAVPEMGKDTPAPAKPVETPSRASGDLASDLANTSEADIDRMFNEALGEKEAAEAAKPAPKEVIKVTRPKGTAEEPPAEPKLVNKGKTQSKGRSLDDISADIERVNDEMIEASRSGDEAVAKKKMGELKKLYSEYDGFRRSLNKGKRPAREDTSSREIKAIAQQFGGENAAVGDAVAALHSLFGASDSAKAAADKLGMAAPQAETFDENVYNTAKPHFQALLDSMQGSGRGVADFIKAVATNFGPGARQYLKRFAQELKTGGENAGIGRSEAGGRDGQLSGGDEASGRGAPAAGGALPADAAGRPEQAAGGEGAERGVRPGVQNGGGGGEGNGLRSNADVAGHEAGKRGGGAASGDMGNRLASANDDAGGHAEAPSLVHASNGNIDTRKSAPVRLTKSQRERINAQARALAEKPVGTLTDAELEILRQFTGAGGLGYRGKSAAEQKAALNQHFTDYTVVDAMWNALEKAGVPMQKALEPSAGVGNIPGRRPELDWTLVELEPTTAKMLRHLFPGAKVLEGTYEDVVLKDMDVAISNVPFLEQRNHTDRPDIKSLHDYFFAKGINQVKPNGVVAFITSSGTMDKLDPAVRRELMSKGDLIGAFRLPQDMFKANAGTSVTTDVIFIQRRPDGVPARPENAAINALFEQTSSQMSSDGAHEMRINSLYAEHPEFVLGDLREMKNKMYGGAPKLEAVMSDATDLSQISINYKPYPVASERGESAAGAASAGEAAGGAGKYPHSVEGLEAAKVKYELSDNNMTFSQNIRMYDGVPHVAVEEFTLDGYEEGTHRAKVFEPVGGELGSKIAELQYIADDATAFQNGDPNAQQNGLAEIADYQKRFKVAPQKDRKLRKFFKDHGEETYLLELSAAFDENFKPADVWHEQTRYSGSGRKQADENSSLLDQALASEDGNGMIHVGEGRSKVAASDVGDLLESGYSLVSGGGRPVLQNNVVFESGNIYEKLDAQRALKESNPEYAAVIDRQIARLEALVPTPKVYDAISFVGNEGWNADGEGWAMPVLRDAGITITRTANDNGMFEYSVSSGGLLTEGERELYARRLGNRKLVTRDDDESDASYLARSREAESQLADVFGKIRARVAEDPERVKRIEDGYNRVNNAYVAPDYNKAGYLIKDTAEAFRKAGFPLRANQRQWVTKALIEGVGINAHDVGGGKTMAALALAHALKARGVCHKPMFVVPAKTINTSWLNSHNGAQVLFPDAKIVNLGNLPADKRSKMLFDLANTNADFVFISHEGFESIELPPDVEAAALRDYADNLIDETGDRQEAKKREALDHYIGQVLAEERDTRLTFDKLGVDCIIADEAHNFKNVGVSSPLERQSLGKAFGVKKDKKTGRVSITSHRAHDFRFKCDYISGMNNGRNVFLLTATPTPNKPIELFTMLRHMGPRVLGDYGIRTDRDFAARFFETGVRPVNSTQGGQAPKEILTTLVNMMDLRAIMDRYIDRIPMEEFSVKYDIPLPANKVETMFVDMSSDMEMVQNEIQERIVAAASRGFTEHHEGEDTIIGAFMNGRDAGVTPYVYGGRHTTVHVEGRTHDPKTDKIELAVQLATHEVQKGIDEGKPRTVIIFTDVMGGGDRPSVPADIKESLIARGFKPSEVAIVTGSSITNPDTGNEVQATGKRGQELKGKIQELFAPKGDKPAAPKVKVVIGSTSTIGEGLNLNTWTTLGLFLDTPLTPGAVQQRIGRYVRFGNQHKNVRTIQLMTRGSFDTLSYGIMANKVGWNNAIWNANVRDRLSVEDEMANGSGVDPRRIIIESLRDPVEKLRRTVEYDLEDRQRQVEQARDQVASFDARIATQKRNMSEAEAREAEHRTSIVKLRTDAKTALDGVPALEQKRDNALADLREYAATTGETAKIDALSAKLAEAGKAKEALEAAKSGDLKAPEYQKKLDDAKIANGKAKEAVEDAIKEFSTDDGKAFAKIYRNAENAIGKAREEAKYKLDSIPYHENIIKNAQRDIEAAKARAKELEALRSEAEVAWRDAQEAKNALGTEWYDDFGGQNQRFKVEKATLQAEMDARNSAEDEWEDWMDERQELVEAMPAPSSTGTRPLNGRKLPGADEFRPSGTEKPSRPVTRAEIFRTAQKLFPELYFTNKGTHHRRGVLGWTEVENRIIRTVDPRAISVLAHELGHGVAKLANLMTNKMPRAARTEFTSLGVDLYGSRRPVGGYASEGFAEFVRGFLCDYDLAAEYPNAHKWFFEDFGDKHPDFVERLFALKEKVLQFANMAPEHEVRAIWDHKLPVTPAEIPFYRRWLNYLSTGEWKTDWVDSNYPILRLMRKTGADKLYNFHDKTKTPAERALMILNHPYMLATFFQGSALRFAEVDAMENTVDLYGDPTGDSLSKILRPVYEQGEEKAKEFWDFAVAMRAANYEKRGITSGLTRGGIAAAIKAYRTPERREVLRQITDWNHRELQLLADAGAITQQEVQDIMDANAVYIPMFRVFAENEINQRRMKAGKRAIFHRKGGSQEIQDPLVAMVEQAARIRAAAQQAKIVQSLVAMYDLMESQRERNVNKFMVEMPNPVKRTTIWADRIKDQIGRIASARFGTDEATIKAAMKDTWTEELFSFSSTRYKGKGNIVTVNAIDPTTGKMKLRTFEIIDKSIADILTAYTQPERVTATERTMQWLANGIRMGATVLKGSFSLVANPIRDTATAFHMQEYGSFIPVISSLDGMLQNVMNTDLNKAYFNMAGDMGRFYNGGRHMAAKEIAAQVKETNAALRQLKGGIFNMIGRIFSIPEIGPRLASFRNAKNYWEAQGVGKTAANMIGRLVGGDITIDFGRAGKVARKANRVFLFLNAAIRELDQLARASGAAMQLPWQNPGEGNDPSSAKARASHARRFWTRGAALTGLALIAYALNNLNEKRKRRWNELKPEYKWNNLVFDFGDEDGESPTVRLPVPFLDGLMFQAAPIAFLEYMRTGDASPLREVATQMGNQLPFSPGFGGKSWYHFFRGMVPSSAVPVTDLLANETWSENAIIPERMKRLDVRDQYTANTTAFSKFMGELLNVSPAKFEYIYDQYTGGLVSQNIRDFENTFARSAAIGVNGDWSKLPIVGRIFLAPFTTSRLPGEFYGEMDKLGALYNSGRSTPEQLGKYRTMENVYESTLAEYSKTRRAVQANPDLSADEAKKLADTYSKATIDVIRNFNEYAKKESFREAGITSAVASICNPGSSDSVIANNRAILERGGVDLSDAQQALKRYGRRHGWSADTMKKRQRFLRNRW